MIDRAGTMTAIVRRRRLLEPPKTGLLGWYRADTLAGADGDAIATWPDSSGNGNDLTQTTPGVRPVLCHDVAGFRGAWFDETMGHELAIPAGLSVDRQAFSFFVMMVPELGLHGGLLGLGAIGDYNLQTEAPGTFSEYYGGAVYSDVHAISRGWSGVVSSSSGHTPLSGEISHTYGAIGSRVVSGGTIGSANGYYPIVGVFNEVLVYDHAVSADELAAVKAYFRKRYSLPIPSTVRVLTDGDSLTSGVKSTNGFTYPNQMALLLSPRPELYNVGIGSTKITDLITSGPTKVDPLYDATKAKNIVVIWGGTNDLYTGSGPADVYASLQTYCAARRTVGWKVVVVTTLPRGAADPFEANRQTYNTSIRAGWATFADALADVAADSRIGDAGDNGDGTYYSDGTHLNNTGYGVVAGIVGAAVQGLL